MTKPFINSKNNRDEKHFQLSGRRGDSIHGYNVCLVQQGQG